MKKQIFRNLLCIIAMAIYLIGNAQTEQLNFEKYWNYRDKFRKQFVKIGPHQGEGINISNIDEHPSDSGQEWTGSFGSATVTHGYRRLGDAMALQGQYIAVLATEYRLLKDAGKDVQGTLNELYYAINAVNRVDRQAEPYFGSGQQSLNGFFMRDDVTNISNAFSNNWTTQATITEDPRDKYEGVKSDYYNPANPVTGDKGNEESQDQMLGLFTGFAHVVKLVDNVYVKPTATDAGFYICDEVKAVTMRMLDWVRTPKIYDNVSYNIYTFKYISITNVLSGLSGAASIPVNSVCDVTENWSILNPVRGKKVTNGSEMPPYIYGAVKTAEFITGNSLSTNSYSGFIHNATDNSQDGNLCIIPHSIALPMDGGGASAPFFPPNNINNLWWDPAQNFSWDPSDILNLPHFRVPIPGSLNPFNLKLHWLSYEGFTQPEYNVSQFLEIATASGSWSHANVTRIADKWKMYIYDLEYAVLHNEAPIHTKAFYEDILNSAPCEGPHNFNLAGGPQDTALSSTGWEENSRWNHPFGPSGFTRGEYNGNDYMWLYNLYQLAFKNTGALPAYSPNACPCESSYKIKANQTNAILNTGITIARRFPAYVNIGIPLNEFLIENLSVQSNKNMNVETDLVVCNNKTLASENNGTITIGNSSGLASSITIRSGSTFKIAGTGKLVINNNSRLLIEEGATLIYESGAQIQLLGNNAVLEIKGDLQLGSNAMFTFTYPGSNSGFIKFSREGWWDNNPHITAGVGASIVLQGKNKNDKILEIAQDILYVSKFQNINFFAIQQGLVEFTKNGQLSTDSKIRFLNSKFMGEGKLVLWGQPSCQINSCIFNKVPILGFLFMYGNKLTIENTEILNCAPGSYSSGIYTQGMGVNLRNVNSHYNAETGWEGMLQTFNSTIAYSKLNDNGSYGVSLRDSPVQFDFTSCQINNNGIAGLDLMGPAVAKLKCGEVKENLSGFSLENDAILSMNTSNGGGYVDASGNFNNTIFLQNAADVDINNGYNDLRISSNPSDYNGKFCANFGNCPKEIVGSINLPPGNNVIANNNKWQPNNNASLVTSGADKYTQVVSSYYNTVTHFLDVAQSDIAPCGYWDPAPCYTCPKSFLQLCPNCNTINTPDFVNKKTNIAVQEALAKMDTTIIGGHKQAINLFHQILKYPLPTPTEGDKYVINFADRQILISLAQAIENKQLIVSDSTLAPEVQKILEIENDKINRAINEGNYLNKYFASMDKALVYYSAQHRWDALKVLDDILGFVRIEQQPYVVQTKCLIFSEQQLLMQNISQGDFVEFIQKCAISKPKRAQNSNMISNESDVKDNVQDLITLYPNPAKDQLNIEYSLLESEQAQFIIYDITGKVLFQKTLKGGKQTEVISDLSLSNGVYLYRVISNDKIIKQDKLTIIK